MRNLIGPAIRATENRNDVAVVALPMRIGYRSAIGSNSDPLFVREFWRLSSSVRTIKRSILAALPVHRRAVKLP